MTTGVGRRREAGEVYTIEECVHVRGHCRFATITLGGRWCGDCCAYSLLLLAFSVVHVNDKGYLSFTIHDHSHYATHTLTWRTQRWSRWSPLTFTTPRWSRWSRWSWWSPHGWKPRWSRWSRWSPHGWKLGTNGDAVGGTDAPGSS